MEEAQDHKVVNCGNTFKLDLSSVKAGYQAERHDEYSSNFQQGVESPYSSSVRAALSREGPTANGAGGTASDAHPSVESPKNELNHECHGAEGGARGAGDDAYGHTVTANAEAHSGTRDNTCPNSSALSSAANNTSNGRCVNAADKLRRHITDLSPPNSSPARLDGFSRKGAFSAFQKSDTRVAARGVPSCGAIARKAASFSTSASPALKSRVVRKNVAVDSTAEGSVGNTAEKELNAQAPRTQKDGQAEKARAAASASSACTDAHQKISAEEEDEEHKAVQQDNETEELCSQTEESEEAEDDDGESESGDNESCDVDSQGTQPSEEHPGKDSEEQGQEIPEGVLAVVETELDGLEAEDQSDVGELRYNMRTGKFSKAHVVRGASGRRRTLPRQRPTIVDNEKGPDQSWIFPWEVRPEIDVFAAAAAARATSSARRRELATRRAGSAPAVSSCGAGSLCAARGSAKGFQEGHTGRGPRRTMQYLGKQSEGDEQSDRLIDERQRESVFDYLSKMAEANEWAQLMKLDRTYRAFKARDGKLACHVYQGKSYLKRLPIEVFMSYEYPRLRRRFMLCCPYLHVQPQAASGSSSNDTEVRTRRELELQNVLLSTIQLTHALREQLDFLQRASDECPRTLLG